MKTLTKFILTIQVFLIGASLVANVAKVVKVVAGSGYNRCLMDDGTLWGMGFNIAGQLGDGTAADRVDPVKIASNVALAAAVDRRVDTLGAEIVIKKL